MLNLREQYDIYLNRGGKDIGYTNYRKITELYNKEVMRQIIEEQKSLFMDHDLGSLHVIEIERKPMKSKRTGRVYTSIKWQESLKRKQEIIDNGQVPFEVIKDENGKEIGDNSGVEWLIYNLSDKIYKFYQN